MRKIGKRKEKQTVPLCAFLLFENKFFVFANKRPCCGV